MEEITKDTLDQGRQFRELCRYYLVQKNWLEKAEETGSFCGTGSYMRENVRIVDGGLEQIRTRFGREAEEIIRQIYIDRQRVGSVAREHGYSVRTVQRRTSEWLKGIEL